MNTLPQANAGAAFHRGIIAGKLNGVMPATTPIGTRKEWTSMPVPTLSLNSHAAPTRRGIGQRKAVQTAGIV